MCSEYGLEIWRAPNEEICVLVLDFQPMFNMGSKPDLRELKKFVYLLSINRISVLNMGRKMDRKNQ